MEKITRLNSLLTALGFPPHQSDDVPLLKWASDQAENYARLELNLPYIPEELEKPLLNIAAGEYLKAKKAASYEEASAPTVSSDPPVASFAPVIKRLELGDTKTEFDTDNSTTPEQRFDLLTEYLITSGKDQAKGYRRLKW